MPSTSEISKDDSPPSTAEAQSEARQRRWPAKWDTFRDRYLSGRRIGGALLVLALVLFAVGSLVWVGQHEAHVQAQARMQASAPPATPTAPAPATPYLTGLAAKDSGGWCAPAATNTLQDLKAAYQACLADPGFVTVMERLSDTPKRTLIVDPGKYASRADRLKTDSDARSLLANRLFTGAISYEVGTEIRSDKYWQLKADNKGVVGQRPDMTRVKVDGLQGTFLVVTYKTSDGSLKAIKINHDMVPIIGIAKSGTPKSGKVKDHKSNDALKRDTTSTASSGKWNRLAMCESGGNWSINSGNGYYGGLQFYLPTWKAHGGKGLPHKASKAEQIRVAERVLKTQGWGAWPSCSKKLGLR